MNKKNELSGANITFFTACRENTGKSLCDSGGAYGYEYDKDVDPEDSPIILSWDEGGPATLNTAVYLNERYEIDRELQEKFDRFCEETEEDLSWIELGEVFMESLEYSCASAENMYNLDTDLSQTFEHRIWVHVDDDPCSGRNDWVFSDGNKVVVINIHTGCDVRGGYGRPIFCRSMGSYTIPSSPTAEYFILSGVDAKGNELSSDARMELCEEWANGYTDYPWGQLEKDVKEFLEETRTSDTVQAVLNTGETVVIQACNVDY